MITDPTVLSPAIFAADAGSVAAGNFAWAASEPTLESGHDLSSPSTLVKALVEALSAGRPVALGFEAPLSLPLSVDPMQLTKARPGEGNRPWSAGAGSGALATGLVELVWVLKELRKQLPFEVPATLDPALFALRGGLLVWEAFVSAGAKGADHVADARAAVAAFVTAWPHVSDADMIGDARDGQPLEYLSLAGAALLHTGWSTDLTLLACRPAVLKAALQAEQVVRAPMAQKAGTR